MLIAPLRGCSGIPPLYSAHRIKEPWKNINCWKKLCELEWQHVAGNEAERAVSRGGLSGQNHYVGPLTSSVDVWTHFDFLPSTLPTGSFNVRILQRGNVERR